MTEILAFPPAIAAPRADARTSPPVPGVAAVVRGAEALRLVHDDAFALAWDYLAASCPWATVFTGRAWAASWYETHAAEFEPVLVVAGDGRRLAGLVPLARRAGSLDLLPAGGGDCELGGWLAEAGDGDRFAADAFAALAAAFPYATVRIARLAPGTPLAWTRTRGWRARARSTGSARAWLDVPGGDAARAWRRKPSNASRLRRLGRVGPVSLARVTDPAAVERLLETAAPWETLRRGGRVAQPAAGPGIPALATSDEHRRLRFLARCADRGLVRVTVLRAGGRVAAVHAGLRDGETLRTVVLAHDPRLARHSPGKLLLRLLAESAANDGVSAIDLGAADPWTARFRTRSEGVRSLRVAMGSAAWLAGAARNVSGTAARCALRAARLSLRGAAAVAAGAAAAARSFRSRAETVAYAIDAARIVRLAWDDRVAVDEIEELILPRGSAPPPAAGGRTAAVSDARRVAAGERCATLAEHGRLTAVAWLRAQRRPPAGAQHPVPMPAGVPVLDEVVAPPAARARGAAERVVRRLLREAVRSGAASVWAFASARDRRRRRLLERVGFRLRARAVTRTVLGTSQRTVQTTE